MKVAFIHFHLKPGGVTRVIQQQISICEQMGWDYCVLAGENPLDIPNVLTLSELHYDLHRSGLGEGNPAAVLAGRIHSAISHFFRCHESGNGKEAGEPDTTSRPGNPDPAVGRETSDNAENSENAEDSGNTEYTHSCADVIHVHNPTLAKNSDLLPALNILKQQGHPLFFQIHDFAEDGRPTVYSSATYPADVHYGCINSRDAEYLEKAGLQTERLHLLPNLVSPLPGAPEPGAPLPPAPGRQNARGSGRDRTRRFALYPVRGIRRKNLGEILLLSLLYDDLDFGITLEPNNPADMPSYRFWESLAHELDAPVYFNTAKHQQFEQALAKADFFITTSVQEGFGFTFLEPWTLGKPVAGRKIPYVHKDFTESGMIMDHFYDEIPVPVSMVDFELFRQEWLAETSRRLSRFRIALRNQELDKGAARTQEITGTLGNRFHELYASASHVDFARLDRENQASVIRTLAASPEQREQLLSQVPLLQGCPFTGCLEQMNPIISRNHGMVYQTYGEDQYAQRLEGIYQVVMQDANAAVPAAPEPKSTVLDKEQLLFSFLDPSQVFLVASL
ncbi:glycosyltransferase family 1 protein [Salinispira pacifica]|uniref:Uncharacterized protein n=1 Tax=Salinispira pacifica TaxID=1307761 RepID=V5WN01_9SPIO|nr:glycosyltransferase family 1 protein [Salinispira pacifica]AHC16544.1 hypothetical protein L21SP2_3204 [Salinispira pacifica]